MRPLNPSLSHTESLTVSLLNYGGEILRISGDCPDDMVLAAAGDDQLIEAFVCPLTTPRGTDIRIGADTRNV